VLRAETFACATELPEGSTTVTFNVANCWPNDEETATAANRSRRNPRSAAEDRWERKTRRLRRLE
jgi:hypothetical protein